MIRLSLLLEYVNPAKVDISAQHQFKLNARQATIPLENQHNVLFAQPAHNVHLLLTNQLNALMDIIHWRDLRKYY